MNGGLTNQVSSGETATVTYTGARHFDHFEIDGIAQPSGQTVLELTVPEDSDAVKEVGICNAYCKARCV